MRVLHTADWHLGDRLGRIDRTHDLRRAVERVGELCRSENIDVLLVAGDLFSELSRADALRETIEHWKHVFTSFLSSGGTILTLTGNHDNETFCQTLAKAMDLAAPLAANPDETSLGRLYLATEPTLLRLRDRHKQNLVQFLLMPYPTPSRYLQTEENRRYNSPEEKSRKLESAFREALRKIQQSPKFDRNLPVILGAHINVGGAITGSSLFRMGQEDDVVFEAKELTEDFDYVALGHIHKPQTIGGRPHVRYSGSIEKMDLGETNDQKEVTVFEIAEEGLIGRPKSIPLPSTPIYNVDVLNPAVDIEFLRQKYREPVQDLVHLHIRYNASRDILEQVLKDLETIFPRWYAREWEEVSVLGPSLNNSEPNRPRGIEETVREYLERELQNHSEEDRKEVLRLADLLLQEKDKD
ncbi:MAG: exonuclease SbcCD subunit D [Gemmataceae bacterium]|jgi:exonuclease SbcD|nr:exonuclease SbcCD subunit D [Gemmataceae bacterium]